MTVIDYLLRFKDDQEALTAAQPWIVIVDDLPTLNTPTFQGAMNITGYTDMGTPATYDDTGEVVSDSTPPIADDAVWWILTLPVGEPMPDGLIGFIKTQGTREDGLPMPDGIKGFNTMLAGVKLV